MSVLVYVDDVIFFGKDLENIGQIINKLTQRQLPLTVESDIFHFLGIGIENQGKSKIILRKCGIIDNIIKAVGMED